MEVFRKTLSFVLMLLLCVSMLAVPAFAAQTSQDGLEIALTADRDSYAQGEPITATLTVTNTAGSAVQALRMEHLIPRGFAVAEGQNTVMMKDVLEAGETVTFTVTFVGAPEPQTPDETVAQDAPSSGGSGSDSDSGNGNVPTTGDGTVLVGWIALVLAAAAGLVLMLTNRGMGRRIMSLALCGVLLGGMLAGVPLDVSADECRSGFACQQTVVTVDGVDVVLEARVEYVPAEEVGFGAALDLEADEVNFVAGMASDITFTVSGAQVAGQIGLYRGEEQVGWMHDDGTGGDAAAGDGIYTCVLAGVVREAGSDEYSARVGNVSSDRVTLYYTAPQIDATGTLSGRICDAADRATPVPNASIAISGEAGRQWNAVPDGTGNYSLELPAGNFRVTITAPGYLPFSAYAAVTADSNTYMETFLLIEESEEEAGVAAGTITNAMTGSGIADVTLQVRSGWNNDDTGDVITTVTTDADGRYSLELPLGNYTVYAAKDGFIPTMVNIVVLPGTTGSQNGSMSPVISGDSFRIVLTWGANPRDLDSHVVGRLTSGSNFHVYYRHKSQYDGEVEACNLDVDDTSGYGPETVTLNTTADAPYYYYIYRYAGSGTVASSEAQVKVYQGENLVATFNVPTDQGGGDYWNVFAVSDGRLVVRDTITGSAETSYASGG